MADIIGPMRPSDSWSTTEIRAVKHTHVWTVKGFSQCDIRYLETSVKIKDPPASYASDTLVFRVLLHPQGNKESNKDFCFFQVTCNSASVKFKAKFSVFNARNEEIPATVYTGTQQLNGYFEYIRRDLLTNHIQPQDELQLVLNLSFSSDAITRSSENPSPAGVEARTLELGRDMETLFKDRQHADFTIICQNDNENREISVHKGILATRSPVFAAMLESHTDELKTCSVVYKDIDYEVMMELLHYIYSGRCPNVQTMALELLAAADRFQISSLKEVCDQVLRNSLMVETVCRNLIVADLYHAQDLKQDSVKFIVDNSNQVIQTEGWIDMIRNYPNLVTEIVSAMYNDRNNVGNDSRLSHHTCDQPAAKRSRLDDNTRRFAPY